MKQRGTTCPRCGRTSYNPHDQIHGYCGSCHIYYVHHGVDTRTQDLDGWWLMLKMAREGSEAERRAVMRLSELIFG